MCPRGNLDVSAARNKGNSALLVSTVLLTAFPHRFVYKADVQRVQHSECRLKPLLLVKSKSGGPRFLSFSLSQKPAES